MKSIFLFRNTIRFMGLAWILCHLTACEQKDKPKIPIDNTDRSLNCIPEKPLSKGEIYVKGMQDFWKIRVNEIWTGDEILNAGRTIADEKETLYEDICHIVTDANGYLALGSQTCLPWRVNTYDSLEKLQQWHQHGKPAENFKQLVSEYWQGKAFDPRSETVYQPEWHNHEAEFAVVMRAGWATYLYPNNCCQILTFNEARAELSESSYWEFIKDKLSSGYNYQDFHFLKVNNIMIDMFIEDGSGVNLLKNPNQISFLEAIKKDMGASFFLLNRCGNTVDIY